MAIMMAKGRSCDVVGKAFPAWLAATGRVHPLTTEVTQPGERQGLLAVNEDPCRQWAFRDVFAH